MANLSGKLLRVADPTAGDPSEPGSILLTLCGYGSTVPYIPGGTIANLEYEIVPEDPTNTTWNLVVAGNDVIVPPGTYYTFAYKNENGDIAQVMAYVFADGQTYDITTAPPFDPSQPPQAIPPLIVNQLEIITASEFPAGALFDGGNFLSFQYNLDMDGYTNVINAQPGNLYTFIIVQDSFGGHSLVWQEGIFNPPQINTVPNGITVQTFVALPDTTMPYGTALYPISAPTWNVP